MSISRKRLEDLCVALLENRSVDEMITFLRDLCTPAEIRDMVDRWHVCRLLHRGNLSYREIRSATGLSLSTIGRVSRFLRDEGGNGYTLILERIKEKENQEEGGSTGTSEDKARDAQ
jgi:TrpR-related protein YerC/YecD